MTKAKRFARAVNAETGETVIEFIGPGRDNDALSEALRILTHQLMLRQPSDHHGGWFFGGSFGYGVKFENDTFMMHPYCWCEKRDCLWCMIWLSNEEDCTEDDARAHRDSDIAKIRALYGDAAAERHGGAPHFWHKPSGLQVWWYKYIGRDNKVTPGSGVTLVDMLASCLQSIGAPSLDECVRAYAEAGDTEAESFKRSMEFAFSEEGRKAIDDLMRDSTVDISDVLKRAADKTDD